uniref:Transposase n=1 Tax=Heterorhabditis bacteriophora TaxID=37862 RepID=A0A1I7WG51_HETBA
MRLITMKVTQYNNSYRRQLRLHR